MQNKEKLFSLLCKPNPKSFPDETEAAIIFTKNKFILTVHLVLIIIQFSTFPFGSSPSQENLLRFIAKTLMLAIFLFFCRSRPLVGQTINAILVNVAVFKLAHLHPDGVHSTLVLSFATPILVFYLTQNIPLTAISSAIQVWGLSLSFKVNLIEAISFTDPDVFAEKFLGTFIRLFIPLQMLNLYVVYSLNNKTAELLKASKKTEEALEQQKIFLYSFSHEMRNPMNSLLGNLDLALMSKHITPELREMLNTSKVCGMLLLNLINTVLDAGKLGLGKLEVNPMATKVHDVFQKAWGISHDIITKKGLKSHLRISKEVPSNLLLDSHRLNQVLMNLIGNAIKFTEAGSIMLGISWLANHSEVSDNCFKPIPFDDEDEGLFEKEYNMYSIKRGQGETGAPQSLILSGPSQEINLERVPQPNSETKGVLKIIIKDTGCGMTGEDLGKLFQKFSQVGHVTSKRQMGTGLGLYISKEIIENMRGQIRAYSKPGKGSIFIICIPTTTLPRLSQSEQEMNVNQHLIPRLKTKKLTTIVADDSAMNVTLVCNFYERIGVQVVGTASNGKMAFEKYLDLVKENDGNIDIITLDIDMPIMNGKEVCERIRKYERENNLKPAMIILISGNYEEKDIFEMLGRRDGAYVDCFLKKPLVFEELCWALYKKFNQ